MINKKVEEYNIELYLDLISEYKSGKKERNLDNLHLLDAYLTTCRFKYKNIEIFRINMAIYFEEKGSKKTNSIYYISFFNKEMIEITEAQLDLLLSRKVETVFSELGLLHLIAIFVPDLKYEGYVDDLYSKYQLRYYSSYNYTMAMAA